MSANKRAFQNSTMKKILFAMPIGQLQMCCLTVSHTQTAPVIKPNTSMGESGSFPVSEPTIRMSDAMIAVSETMVFIEAKKRFRRRCAHRLTQVYAPLSVLSTLSNAQHKKI